jgi:adenine-specific DNA-methyltransferase
MIQIPEPISENLVAFKEGCRNISDIGKLRVSRAGDEISTRNSTNQGQPSLLSGIDGYKLDLGFKVFRLDSSNIRTWRPAMDAFKEALQGHIESLFSTRSKLDIVYEIMLKYGIDLCTPIDIYSIDAKEIFSIGYGSLIICLADEIDSAVAKRIVGLKEELDPEVVRVVFRDSGFKDDSTKVNVKEILRMNGIDEMVSI